MTQSYTEVEVRHPAHLRRFEVVLYSLLAAYATTRCLSFSVPLLVDVRPAAVPAVVASTVSLQVWAALWGAGALLHLAGVWWTWARVATVWAFSVKGLAVAVAFFLSATAEGGSVPASFGGVVSYGTPVLLFWLVQWALAMRTTVVVQSVPVVQARAVANAARDRIRAETGEIPEVTPRGT